MSEDDPRTGNECAPSFDTLIRVMGNQRDPCQTCCWYQRCATYRLACGDFHKFVTNERRTHQPTYGPDHERSPSDRLYIQIFNDNEEIQATKSECGRVKPEQEHSNSLHAEQQGVLE
ncbi:hypothetical protein [Aquisalimonas asiatica]|uniref:Uncharacterized protein n=1 Tax=Aquisalimonas asiatica TaxID=406100 RepID=A0A1H8UCT2_9GAMM|nr:hypothetical protein [Aquisalimonas asiatica]SEP00916.1 hypothetical protein SAMN04488052_10696 [Aquisalimonas asiatica]